MDIKGKAQLVKKKGCETGYYRAFTNLRWVYFAGCGDGSAKNASFGKRYDDMARTLLGC